MLSKRRRRWLWSQNSHSMNFWQRHTAARSRRFRPTLEALEDRRLLSDFLVTSTRDDGSTNTLRWAINQANTDQGPTTEIDIDNTTLPTNTIRVSSPLPAITHPVSILVVPETDRHPPFMSIILDGSNAGGLANGLVIETDSCHVQGLTIQNFSGSGILISGTQASAGIIECVIQNNGSNGVTMQAGANHNELDLDVLSGNFAAGVLITDSGTNHNDVTNSQIGTTADGSAAQGNSSGVVIENGASSNNISADTISGNSFDGVDVLGPGTINNDVSFNRIGTNADGSAPLGNGANGVLISAGPGTGTVPANNTIRFNLISSNTTGIVLTASGTMGDVIEANHIGTDATFSHALGNGDGVVINGGANNNTVGPMSADIPGNVISGNVRRGIWIDGAGSDSNMVLGNTIGTQGSDPSLGNEDGVAISNGAMNNQIGTNAVGYTANVIAGNQNAGVAIVDASDNSVEGNILGKGLGGTQPLLGNGFGVNLVGAIHNSIGDPSASGTSQGGNTIVGNVVGVWIHGAATDNIVGGRASGAGNVFSANVDGVLIEDPGTMHNQVGGNNISGSTVGVAIDAGASNNIIGDSNQFAGNQTGVEISDSFPFNRGTTNNIVEGNNIGNASNPNGTGVLIGFGASMNTIGPGNVIFSSSQDGIDIQGPGTTGNVVQGNIIGADSTGQRAAPNRGDGILINGGATNNTVGNGNIIAFNARTGVAFVDNGIASSVNNAIQGNSIFGNQALGIDLGGDGVTANTPGGPHTGPNDLQNYPTLVYRGAGTVDFSLSSGTNGRYIIDFYANATPDPSGHGQGKTWLGSMPVFTDDLGNAGDTFAFNPVPGEPFITATATDFFGNTSEFSGAVGPPHVQAFNGTLQIGLDSVQHFVLQPDPVFPQLVDLGFDGSMVSIDPMAFAQMAVTASAGSVIDIEDVPTGTPLSITGGSGAATVNLSPVAQNLGNIQGPVTVQGGSGSLTLNIDDQAGPTTDMYTLDASTFQRANFGGLTYVGIASLNINLPPGNPLPGYQSTQNVYVLGTPAGMTTTITADNGSHNITVGLPTSPTLNTLGLPGSPLENIQGPVTVNGDYQDNLTLWDWDSTTAQKTYAINSNSISPITAGGAASAPISWQGRLSTVVLFGSAAADTYQLQSLPTDLAALVVDGYYRANTFQSFLPDRRTWGIYANEAVGSFIPGQCAIDLGEVYNFTGGPSGNDFAFLPSYGRDGKFDGVLNGNGGTLDYSQDSSPITVNLANHSASNIDSGAAGGFSNIQSVIGNNASTTLVAPDTTNYWNITGPNQGNLGPAPNQTGGFTFSQVPNLTGGAAADDFVFGPTGSLSGVLSGGDFGTTDNTLDLSAYTSSLTVHVFSSVFGGTVAGVVNDFALCPNVIGGQGDDRFIIDQGYGLTTLDGGPGNNTLDLSPYYLGPQVIGILQRDAGYVAGEIGWFSHVQNLVTGTTDDTFAFRGPGHLDGSIDGGGGTNTLDYSQYAGNITVDLALNLASLVNQGAAGGIFHIANVTGSMGDDLLVGDANANVLIGGTGRNLLIGGGGADSITGGGGDNIQIGGYTSYDQNLVALDAVFAEWTSADSLSVRLRDLRNGGGLNGTYILNATASRTRPATVFDDGAPDLLFDGTGLSWFFVHRPNDRINNGAGPHVRGDVITHVP